MGALSAQISVFSNLREKKTLIAWAVCAPNLLWNFYPSYQFIDREWK